MIRTFISTPHAKIIPQPLYRHSIVNVPLDFTLKGFVICVIFGRLLTLIEVFLDFFQFYGTI